MNLTHFGQALLETGDLDPVYIALVKSKLRREQLAKWLVAYWCLYSSAASSWLSEQQDFWRFLAIAAENKQQSPAGDRWPRGTERRHWRGIQAIKSAEHLCTWGQPINIVDYLAQSKTAASVMSKAQMFTGFGPWIAFKVADMLERIWGAKIDFNETVIFMFESPKAGADLFWSRRGYVLYNDGSHREEAIAYLIDKFKDYKAPPLYDRPVNIQEIETILCKYYAHRHGTYPVGKDIREIRHGLNGWVKVSPTAEKFLRKMPPEVAQDGRLI